MLDFLILLITDFRPEINKSNTNHLVNNLKMLNLSATLNSVLCWVRAQHHSLGADADHIDLIQNYPLLMKMSSTSSAWSTFNANAHIEGYGKYHCTSLDCRSWLMPSGVWSISICFFFFFFFSYLLLQKRQDIAGTIELHLA
jgi:hypothetical protein